ncbi:calexcitin-2-like [Physella acuta]|uniref:calexcitin-2-like n=1 Tax=Physella acuta TaxID=109671 RepID=UPI0027DE1274|nr:calexcitin-2-like [Physella acuta]
MASLTEFQRKKILNLFENLYDTNKDGVIEKCDFDAALEKISTLHHWKTNDEAFKKAQDTVSAIWEGLRKRADKNKDGRITKEEWTKMWEECIKDVVEGRSFPEWQQEYMEFMFYANDTSGDGFIDRGEYTAIYELFGFSNDDVNKCFDKISEGLPNNMLSKSDFEALWRDYFVAENDDAKGNFLFGQQKH